MMLPSVGSLGSGNGSRNSSGMLTIKFEQGLNGFGYVACPNPVTVGKQAIHFDEGTPHRNLQHFYCCIGHLAVPKRYV